MMSKMPCYAQANVKPYSPTNPVLTQEFSKTFKRFATGPQLAYRLEYGLNNDKDNNGLKGTAREKLVSIS